MNEVGVVNYPAWESEALTTDIGRVSFSNIRRGWAFVTSPPLSTRFERWRECKVGWTMRGAEWIPAQISSINIHTVTLMQGCAFQPVPTFQSCRNVPSPMGSIRHVFPRSLLMPLFLLNPFAPSVVSLQNKVWNQSTSLLSLIDEIYWTWRYTCSDVIFQHTHTHCENAH